MGLILLVILLAGILWLYLKCVDMMQSPLTEEEYMTQQAAAKAKEEHAESKNAKKQTAQPHNGNTACL